MFKLILNLLWNRANKRRWQMELGTYLLRQGVQWKIGDPVQVPNGRNKVCTMWISNLFYDFQKNHIQHSLTSKKPFRKESEKRG
ncbi:hypothetical protein ETU08_01810 [Apibacter muscae]|uniref:Uncharacterized protein n=1 Tax=Apibacter muscae TaxID=2509004 RepID=A0A563DK18_9FLAO|nr:hypothetical protein [Apibacter muscae]TWP30520.1 hypothetical protein ETU09_00535 [Apibacter muscae]TWP31241.1 hypothetical protein ETU08_01810 [Apibacter muscae]